MKKILLLAIAAFLVVGCSNEDNASTFSQKRELDLLATVSQSQHTRALISDFATDDEIGVFITGTDYTPQVASYKLKLTGWSNEGAKKIYLGVTEATVYAYYPATLSPTTTLANGDANLLNITLPKESTGLLGEGQTDLMFATPYPAVSLSSVVPALEFNHSLSKLSFVVNAGWGYTDSKTITAFKINKVSSFNYGDATMAVKDGAINWGATPQTTPSFTFSGSATMNDYNTTPATKNVLECLMPPSSGNTDVSITLTINGVNKTVNLPSNNGSEVWAAGNNYKYTITVYGPSLVISPAQIVDWTDEDVPNTDLKLNQ